MNRYLCVKMITRCSMKGSVSPINVIKTINVITTIHRMQIWRTARLLPGTSCMKARLVRLRCFVLTMLS